MVSDSDTTDPIPERSVTRPPSAAVLRGTLDLLILKARALGEVTGSRRRYAAAVDLILGTT